jgi:hypothetical protein
MKRPRAAIIPVIFMTSFLQDGFGHFANCIDLDGVSFDALVPHHEDREQPRGDTKDTLGRVELPLVGMWVGEGISKVGDELILLSGLDDHVVDVGFHILPNLGLQALLYRLLVGRANIFQANGHDLVAVDVVGCYERRFVLVIGVQGYLVIS